MAILLAPRIVNDVQLERIADTVWDYGSAETVNIPKSRRNVLSRSFRDVTGHHTVPQPHVFEVYNADIYGPDAIARTDDGHLILNTIGGDRFFLSLSILRQFRAAPIRTVKWVLGDNPEQDAPVWTEPVFSLVGLRSLSYYHWTVEFLPKVRAIQQYEQVTGLRPIVLIEPDPPDWKLESLDLLGIERQQLREWTEGWAQVEHLITSPHRPKRPDRLVPSPDDIEWVRNQILSNLKIETESKRVYVSRADAENRQVVNEDEVFELLSEYGFESYVLSDLAVAEQARLFASAECIIAPHGAGLTNLVYTRDAAIIELFLEDVIRPYYYIHAQELGLEYNHLLCERRESNILVDLDELRTCVEKTLEGVESK